MPWIHYYIWSFFIRFYITISSVCKSNPIPQYLKVNIRYNNVICPYIYLTTSGKTYWFRLVSPSSKLILVKPSYILWEFLKTCMAAYYYVILLKNWWVLFQKHVVHTNFDIYVFIILKVEYIIYFKFYTLLALHESISDIIYKNWLLYLSNLW